MNSVAGVKTPLISRASIPCNVPTVSPPAVATASLNIDTADKSSGCITRFAVTPRVGDRFSAGDASSGVIWLVMFRYVVFSLGPVSSPLSTTLLIVALMTPAGAIAVDSSPFS